MVLKKNWKKSNIEDFDDSNHVYFTKDTERKIVEYKYGKIPKFKQDKIYKEHIYPVFTEMIKIMIHRYKFYHTGYDYETLIQEINVHMYHQLNTCNYNPENGAAYSYFSRMAKNKLIQMQDKNQKIHKKYGFESINNDDNYYENILHEEEEVFNSSDFLKKFLKFIHLNFDKIFFKEDEISIAKNILNIMEDDRLVIKNKKILYYMIKEQEYNKNYKINKVINTMKFHYERLKDEYLSTYTFDYNWEPEELTDDIIDELEEYEEIERDE